MIKTLVLLPGLDGTGSLFADFVSAFPSTVNTIVVRYPPREKLTYGELLPHVQASVPKSEPYVLVAESFSTPLAVMFGAMRPPNMVGLVMCTGFVFCPLRKWKRIFRMLAQPLLFQFPPPDIIIEYLLAGRSAPSALKHTIHQTLRLVDPEVLTGRVHEVLNCDVRKELLEVNVPILYLQAGNDRLVRSECFEEIQQLQKDAILASISSPHLILQREPHQAAEAVMGFLNRLEDGEALH